jgi:transcriptional regulator with XRE-family HTH domain
MRDKLLAFLADATKKAGGAKALAFELTQLGYGPVDEQTIRAYRRGDRRPTPDLVFAIARRFNVSVDEYIFSNVLQATFAERFAELEAQVRRMAARMEAWEIEWAAAAGQEPPAPRPAEGTVDLAIVRLERQLDEAQRQLRDLRQQQG